MTEDTYYAWRPANTLYLTLQEALQVGEGSTYQDSDAGHFECSLVNNWAVYADGSSSFSMRVRPHDSEEDSLSDSYTESPVENITVAITRDGDSDPLALENDPIASGLIGYSLLIDVGDELIEKMATSFDEVEAILATYHPEPNRWEPGGQGDEFVCVANVKGGPLFLLIQSDKASTRNAACALVAQPIPELPGIIFKAKQLRFGGVDIQVTPNDVITMGRVALYLAQALNLDLLSGVSDYDKPPLR